MYNRNQNDDERRDYWLESYGNMDGRTLRDRFQSLKTDRATTLLDWFYFARWIAGLLGLFLTGLVGTIAFGGFFGYVIYRDLIVGHGTLQDAPWLLGAFFVGCLIFTLMTWLKVRDLW